MSYTPPAYNAAGGSLSGGYTTPAFASAGGDLKPPAITGATFEPDPLTVEVGASASTSVGTTLAAGAAVDAIVYLSSDAGVATVSGSGVISGVSVGSCTVSATITASGPEHTTAVVAESITVNIIPAPIVIPRPQRMILVGVVAKPGGDYYVASDWYATRPTDTPANVFASARLAAIYYESGVSFPVWNRGGGAPAISEVEILNTDGELDGWIDLEWKGVRVNLYIVPARAAWVDAEAVGSVIVDRIEAAGLSHIRLVCRSAAESLDGVISGNYADDIPNVQQRSQPKPITLGRVKWCDFKTWRTDGGTAATRAVLDVCDDYFEGIYQVLQRGGTSYTETPEPALTAASKWWLNQGNDGFGIIGRDSTYRLAAEVLGQLRIGDQKLSHPTFASGWDAQWTVVDAAGAVVLSGSDLSITGDGADSSYIEQVITGLTVGRYYQIEVAVVSQTGSANIQKSGTVLRTFEACASFEVRSGFEATATSETIRFGVFLGQSGTVVVSAVRCYEAFRINGLAEVLRFAAGRRGMSETDIDFDAAAAIEVNTPYRLAFHSAGELNGIELVRLACASYGVAMFQNAAGKLAPVRLAAPSASADFAIIERRIKGGIEVEVDLAPGLSTRMNYGRNYAVHSEEDAQVASAALREELMREVSAVTTSVVLDPLYGDAAGREPIETILESEADAQDEIDRLCGLYAVPRKFYTLIDVDASDIIDPLLIQPGQTVSVTHSRFGLIAGKNLLVVHRRSSLTGGRITLICWG